MDGWMDFSQSGIAAAGEEEEEEEEETEIPGFRILFISLLLLSSQRGGVA